MESLENLSAEMTYRDVESMIHGEVARFARENSVRPALASELLSVAHVAFMKAYHTHDASKGAMTTKLWWTLYGGFQDALRRDINHDKYLPTVAISEEYEDRQRKGTITRLLEELGEDAREIVYAVVEQPVPLSRGPITAKKRLWRWFKNLGWTRQRITDAFDEIREAMS